MSQLVYIKRTLANIIKISKIVTIHYFEFDKGFTFSGEGHDFWELVYEDKGEVIVTADDREFILKQGEAVFHKPNEFHNIRANGLTAPNVFIISFDTNSRAMNFFKNKVLKVPAELKTLISKIISEGNQAFELPFFNPYLNELVPKKNAPIGTQQLIRLYLEQFLILLLRAQSVKENNRQLFDSKDSMDNHIVSAIIRFLQENICNAITVADVCRHLHYGNTYISTVFKEITGYGIKEYYTLLKIAEAKRLIRERNYTFSEISAQLSFDSPQYFSKRFKAITKMTPKEYANSVRIN